MKREKKGGIALGACWSFSQNLLKHFAERFLSVVFPFAIRWSCCRAGDDLGMSLALHQDKAVLL